MPHPPPDPPEDEPRKKVARPGRPFLYMALLFGVPAGAIAFESLRSDDNLSALGLILAIPLGAVALLAALLHLSFRDLDPGTPEERWQAIDALPIAIRRPERPPRD